MLRFLGRHDAYQDIFDHSDPKDQKPVQYLPSLDLTEILEDLDEGHSLLDASRAITPADVLWQWRFDFTSHWGRHAAAAIKVINSLLHSQFVDALEERRLNGPRESMAQMKANIDRIPAAGFDIQSHFPGFGRGLMFDASFQPNPASTSLRDVLERP